MVTAPIRGNVTFVSPHVCGNTECEKFLEDIPLPRDDTTPAPFIDIAGLRAKALAARSEAPIPWAQRAKLAMVRRSDSDFIAAFSPDVVLYLLNEYEARRAPLAGPALDTNWKRLAMCAMRYLTADELKACTTEAGASANICGARAEQGEG